MATVGLDDRGVSEILGAILVFAVVFASSVAYLSVEMRRAKGEVAGITDLVRAAEHRQAQLLSLVYYSENRETGLLRVYIFNYGTENAEVYQMYIGTERVEALAVRDSFTGAPLDSLPPRTLAEISLQAPTENIFDFTLVTRWKAVYSWRLSV